MAQHHIVNGVQNVLDNAGHMGMGVVVQHSDILCRPGGMLSLDGDTKVSEGTMVMVHIDGDGELNDSLLTLFR
jgi:hypothetical protein